MTRLQEQIETVLPLEPTFDFVADFANAERWDPGVFRSTRLDDGPLRQGSRFALDVRLGQRIAPMSRLDAVRSLGFDERFIRMWEYYLALSEAGFATGISQDLQIAFEKRRGIG